MATAPRDADGVGETAAAAAVSAAAAPLDEHDWRCAICLELLFKPCVNACGHAACFWCTHQAMNPYAPSNCPLCRAVYAHLPRVCARLHALLGAALPEQYAARAAETAEEERARGAEAEAVAVPPAVAASAAAVAAGRVHDDGDGNGGDGDGDGAQGSSSAATAPTALFACDACNKLLLEPCVLPCAHVVCRGCVPAASAGGSAGGSATVAPAAAGPRPRCGCPVCGMALLSRPGVCLQLEKLLRARLPRRTAAREAEAAAATAAASGAAAAADEPQQQRQLEETKEREQAPSQQQQQQQHPRAAAAALLAAGRPLRDAWPELRRALLADADASFVWHGVGCDSCGLYPIVGARYRCLDCPEAIGFDLCGACHGASAAAAAAATGSGGGDGDAGGGGSAAAGAGVAAAAAAPAGRFNQRHTSAHRLAKVAVDAAWGAGDDAAGDAGDGGDAAAGGGGGGPRDLTTLVNVLQMAHQDLSPEQILRLLFMQMRPEEEEDGGGSGGNSGGDGAGEGEAGAEAAAAEEDQQQQQRQGHEGGRSGGG